MRQRPWIPDDFVCPSRVELTPDTHLRPIRGTDVDIDMIAVMGSRDRLWAKYGAAWRWPPSTMTREQDLADLERHAADMEARQSFNYAILDDEESELLGCVYVDPSPRGVTQAEVSWWLIDRLDGSELDDVLDRFVPRWIESAWPFEGWHGLLD